MAAIAAINRRQAISMEQLNNIHNKVIGRSEGGCRESSNAGGSLSSAGSSSTSLDSTGDEASERQRGPSGLSRSASRVSRFRSAKEFFERLSSINGVGGSHGNVSVSASPAKPPLPERPKGNVMARYAPAVSKAAPQPAPAPPLNQVRSRPIVTIGTYSSTARRPKTVELADGPSPRSLVSASIEALLACGQDSPEEPLEPAPLFLGDNVIVGSGSLLVRRNKQLRIKFDEAAIATTFEYPSEEALASLAESPASEDRRPNRLIRKSLVGGSLSDYKPSSLLIEVPDSNIDHKLGVKKLVSNSLSLNGQRLSGQTTNGATSLSLAKSRNHVDQCAATNNGSVIYAQSNSIRNGFPSNSPGDINRNSHIDYNSAKQRLSIDIDKTPPKESQTSTFNDTNSRTNGVYRASTSTLQSASITLDNKKLAADKLTTNNNHQVTSVQYGSSVTKSLDKGYCKSEHETLITDNSEEDLNHHHHQLDTNATKWSNSTLSTTSDLLF